MLFKDLFITHNLLVHTDLIFAIKKTAPHRFASQTRRAKAKSPHFVCAQLCVYIDGTTVSISNKRKDLYGLFLCANEAVSLRSLTALQGFSWCSFF